MIITRNLQMSIIHSLIILSNQSPTPNNPTNLQQSSNFHFSHHFNTSFAVRLEIVMERVIEGQANIQLIQSSLHGNGIASKKKCHEGEVLFLEIPSLFLQSIPNRQDVIVCAFCSRFVGTCGTQLMLLSKEISRLEYINENLQFPGDIQLSSIVPCIFQCGEVYCSEVCRAHHLENGHSLLCTGRITEEEADESPLIQFKQHAVQTNEIFLLIGELFARFCSVLDRSGSIEIAISNVLSPYETFQRHLWWDVAVAPPHEQVKLQNTLKQLVSESWELLNRTLQLEQRGIASLLNQEYLARYDSLIDLLLFLLLLSSDL